MKKDMDVVILSSTRTPLGNFQGSLKAHSATDLGAAVIKSVVEKVAPSIEPVHIQEVLMGCVLPAGLGQAPARQAALKAGLPVEAACTTINKVCASSMKAVMLAHDMLKAGTCEIVLAGGMESMTNAPYLLPKARAGYRIGHQHVLDHMFTDGLEDAYDKGQLMGVFAENCASDYHFSREAQDAFALRSLERASTAQEKGVFQKEITPIDDISTDEGVTRSDPEKIPHLKPAFKKDGTITAANSSSISDGASALLLSNSDEAERRGIQPIARILAHASHAQTSSKFTTAPIYAIEKLMKKLDWTVDDVDLFEINEAFAVVVMAAMQSLKLPHEKVNVHGGACVLGHPLGATGARLLVTLLNALQVRGLKRGIAALCIGGGEATAVAVEIL